MPQDGALEPQSFEAHEFVNLPSTGKIGAADQGWFQFSWRKQKVETSYVLLLPKAITGARQA